MNNKGITKLAVVLIIVGVVIVILLILPPLFRRGMVVRRPPPGKVLAPEEIPVQVKTFKVARTPFEDSLSVLGTVKGVVQVDLRFEVKGVIETFNFREGDLVEKGDVIATLDRKDAILKLEFNRSKARAAKATSLAAEKKLEINKKLYELGAIIEAKLEEVRLEYEAAKAQAESAAREVEFAEAELEKTYLYSPMTGVMGEREVDPGEFVTPQTKIGSVFDIVGVYVEVGIIEKDIKKVALGQKAKVAVDAHPGVEFWGEVDNIPSHVEGKSRTFPCKIRVDNPRALLKPGMFARSDIQVFQRKEAIVIPNIGILDEDGDGVLDTVYIAEEGVARARRVKVGYVAADYAEILEGLYVGEEVIVETGKKLSDGTKVEVIEVQEARF